MAVKPGSLVLHNQTILRVALLSAGLALGALLSVRPAAAQDDGKLTPPTVLTHVDAVYPASALASGVHADVILVVTIDVNGHVSNVEVAKSATEGRADSTRKELDEAAIAAMRQWTFRPATRNGKPVASRIRVPYHFAPPPPPGGPAPEQAPSPVPLQGTAVTPGSQVGVATAGTAGATPAAEEVKVSGKAPPRGTSDFRIPKATLTAAPHASGADMLKTAPGVYVARPEGDAVAQQIFVRGFDADHGQDVEIKVAGIPLNQPSHVHGQGYADLNFVIPETVRELRVVEGVHDPHQGDFAIAGSVDYELGVEERRSRLKLSYGSFDTQRLLGLWAPEGQHEETFGAATFRSTDGFGDGTRGATSGGFIGQYRVALPNDTSLLFHVGGYGARASLAGTVRRDDVDSGRIGFYDAYPDASARAQSAATSRAQVGVSFDAPGSEGSRVAAGLWLYLASFRQRRNFTGYTEQSALHPDWTDRGDLFDQTNDDLGVGGSVSYRSRRHKPLSWLGLQYELGGEARTHAIDQAANLIQAPDSQVWDRRVDARVKITDIGLYADGLLAFSNHVRVRGGVRGDFLLFDVEDRLANTTPASAPQNSLPGAHRTAEGTVFGPRVNVEGDPTPWLRLTASYGEGFRSPHAGLVVDAQKLPFSEVRSYEVGATVRDEDFASFSLTGFQTNLSSDQALEAGEVEQIGPTTRRGLVAYFLSNPTPWMHLALSATYVRATLDSPPVPTPEEPNPPITSDDAIPFVPPLVVRSDVGFRGSLGVLAGKSVDLRAGYGATFLSSRPLPYGFSSTNVFLLDAQAAVRRDWLEIGVEATNLLGLKYASTQDAFASNWRLSPAPVTAPAQHITAGAPRAILGTVTLYL